MRRDLPIIIRADLSFAIGDTVTRVTPTAGLRLAERLIRVSTRELVRQEAEQATRAITSRKPVTR